MSEHTDLVTVGGGISGASLLYAVANFTDVDDVERAKGYGGVRPQIVDTESKEVDMDEAKIAGDGIPFNITPSPGASTALKNAMTDARTVLDFFDADRESDEAAFREATVERFPRVDDEAAANPDADDKPDEADGDDADRVPAEVDE